MITRDTIDGGQRDRTVEVLCDRPLKQDVFAAGGQFFLTYAYQQAPASEVSIYQYSGVVFTAVFSYAFLGETLSKSSIIGGIVILGAIFWVFENTRKEKNT